MGADLLLIGLVQPKENRLDSAFPEVLRAIGFEV